MGNRVSGRSRHHNNKPTSGDPSSVKSAPTSGSVSVRLRAAAVRVAYRRSQRAGEPQVNLGQDAHLPPVTGACSRSPDVLADMPDVTVYRSYAGELTTHRNDDDATMNDRGRLSATVTDSVPDIKIYRRSAVLYTGDDDDDFVIHRSNTHRSVCLSVCHTRTYRPSRSALLRTLEVATPTPRPFSGHGGHALRQPGSLPVTSSPPDSGLTR